MDHLLNRDTIATPSQMSGDKRLPLAFERVTTQSDPYKWIIRALGAGRVGLY